MKKVVLAIVIFIAVVGGLILANRNNERAEFNKEIAEINAFCNNKNFEWGKYRAFEFKDSVFTMCLVMNDDYVSSRDTDFFYKMYENDHQSFSNTMKYFVSSMFVKLLEDRRSEKFYNHLKQYVSVINFKFELSGKTISENFKMSSIAELTDKFRDNPKEAMRAALQQKITMKKANLPMQIDEMTTAIDEFLDDDMLVYVYELDENQVSISNIEPYLEYIKQSMLNYPGIRNNVEQFNVDITFRYVGSISGKSFDLVIRASDLY